MSYQLYQMASFGSGKEGLTTVGYQLVQADGTLSGSRVITGVQDLGYGSYGALITYPAAFRGRITWDSGEAVPLGASDVVNPETGEYLSASVTSVVTAIGVVQTAVSAVQTSVTAAQTAIATAQTALTAVQSSVNGIVTQITALPAAVLAYLKTLIP